MKKLHSVKKNQNQKIVYPSGDGGDDSDDDVNDDEVNDDNVSDGEKSVDASLRQDGRGDRPHRSEDLVARGLDQALQSRLFDRYYLVN